MFADAFSLTTTVSAFYVFNRFKRFISRFLAFSGKYNPLIQSALQIGLYRGLPTHFSTGRGVQVSHRATHNVHKRLEVIILLLDQVVLDRIALDEIVFEDGVRPDTELGAAPGFDAVAYGDDYVEVE